MQYLILIYGGRSKEAVAAYQEALRLVRTAAERQYLERRLFELGCVDD